ncbi:MAG: hypothetical protein U5L01_12085 [Rheinheimera sp.]|nr:hypothetical protein [Rheinheimera sp.]
MLDLGATVNCDSDTLFQFAVMGAVMAEEVEGIHQPEGCFAQYGRRRNQGL